MRSGERGEKVGEKNGDGGQITDIHKRKRVKDVLDAVALGSLLQTTRTKNIFFWHVL